MKRFLKQIMTLFSGQRSIQIELDKALTRISFLEFQLSVKELEKRQKQLCIDNLQKTLREIEISLAEAAHNVEK